MKELGGAAGRVGARPTGGIGDPARWAGGLAVASAVLSLVSVFLSGLALGLAVVAALVDGRRRRRWTLQNPPFGVWLGVYVAFVLAAILLSPDPVASLRYGRKLARFAAVFLIFTYARPVQIGYAYAGIALLGALSGVWGILQYAGLKEIDLLHRVDGFMSHWMTFSGQMMMVALLFAASLLARGRFWRDVGVPSFLLPIGWVVTTAALVVTFTRSAWLGLAAGTLVLLALERRRWVLPGLAFLAAGFLLLPGTFHERLLSGLDLKDTTTQGRLELWETGAELIRLEPWFGVGPRLVQEKAVELRGARFPRELYQHLHNNVLQVAAETGLLTLAAWLALWGAVAWHLWRLRRNRGDAAIAASLALAVLAAFHTMGMMEYNFGDSEIAALTWFFVTAPFAWARRPGAPRDAGESPPAQEVEEVPHGVPVA
ncbi:MAG: hypothetical protein Kow00109_07980 [Acidobacteriota bacterium]